MIQSFYELRRTNSYRILCLTLCFMFLFCEYLTALFILELKLWWENKLGITINLIGCEICTKLYLFSSFNDELWTLCLSSYDIELLHHHATVIFLKRVVLWKEHLNEIKHELLVDPEVTFSFAFHYRIHFWSLLELLARARYVFRLFHFFVCYLCCLSFPNSYQLSGKPVTLFITLFKFIIFAC